VHPLQIYYLKVVYANTNKQKSSLRATLSHSVPTKRFFAQILKFINKYTVISANYTKPAYNELLPIRNWFSFPNFRKELVLYTFIRNSGIKKHIFMATIHVFLISGFYCI